ncbi:MAG: cytochrome c [Candidatus Hydrogenedentes bacterium]|nr:cytochrome c [Candidatus Hydrogenedentota bacterium]
MWNQPRVAALQRAEFYPDTMGSRGPVPGTVRYEGIRRRWTAPVFDGLTGERNVPLLTDTTFWTGKTPEGFLPDNYFTLTRALLERGRDRFEVSCMPCHGLVGDGRGVVAQRGFPNPASYHTDRLREVEDGYIFDVVTNGFGRMYSYASRVAPEDRWAIAAYIRALQTSQNLDVTDRNSTLAQLVVGGLKEQEQAKAQAAPATHGEAAHEETAHGEAEVNHAQ